MRNRYVTTTLPYINDKLHLGHAVEFVQADAYVRVFRRAGENVFLNIGTDEHGAKIAKKAESQGKTPEVYADEYAGYFKMFADTFGISYDAFTRTTDRHHLQSAQAFWEKCAEAGDIYKAAYEVKYCTGCELEKTDSELVSGRCPLHPNQEIEIRTEENYYFRFSRFTDDLLKLYTERPEFVVPKERLGEIRSFVTQGLKDFSISRRKEKLSWGVPVPGDEEHVMYVWFDALANYVSAIGWPDDMATFETWWPVTQFAGKDNLRQQSAMWQAMLMSAGLEPSRQIFIHGFITSGGQKMSKSVGNVIDPMELMNTYGVDGTRYLILRHVNPFEDADLTNAAIREHYTAHLTNGLGNLVARVMKLCEDHLESPVEAPDISAHQNIIQAEVERFSFNTALDTIFSLVSAADEYMTKEQPFKVIKEDPVRAKAMLTSLAGQVWTIGALLAPFMPETSAKIVEAVMANKKPDNLFPRLA